MWKYRKYVSVRSLCISLLLLLLPASPALAIQSHGPPEGLYVHQIGHFLYGLAMLGFAFRIRLSRLVQKRSWRLMTLGAILLACWNVWAVIAHIIDRAIPLADFQLNELGIKTALNMHTPVDWFYYLFKMDHLLCVPALLLIYLALRRMNISESSVLPRKSP